MIDFAALRRLKSYESAELLRSFGQLPLVDSDQHGPIVSHHGHALLNNRAFKTFITHLARTTREQTGDVTFDDRTTVTTYTG